MSREAPWTELVRRGLGRADVAVEPKWLRQPGGLLRLCHAGALVGGLSVALDLEPDELVGPLAHALGGAAGKLRIEDARGRRPMELHVRVGDVVERWELEDCAALVHNLNDLYRDDAGVKVAAVLGEWEDMLQLWCVPKRALGWLVQQPFFTARNLQQLETLL